MHSAPKILPQPKSSSPRPYPFTPLLPPSQVFKKNQHPNPIMMTRSRLKTCQEPQTEKLLRVEKELNDVKSERDRFSQRNKMLKKEVSILNKKLKKVEIQTELEMEDVEEVYMEQFFRFSTEIEDLKSTNIHLANRLEEIESENLQLENVVEIMRREQRFFKFGIEVARQTANGDNKKLREILEDLSSKVKKLEMEAKQQQKEKQLVPVVNHENIENSSRKRIRLDECLAPVIILETVNENMENENQNVTRERNEPDMGEREVEELQ
ncbi:unnamed protein product [Orchesella dallaii]|uniref:Uncharacterized protein n=1 Tax=Orchesella dallaii TaxID=48710 RepID=A0ABP1RHW9_9HEXA